MSLLVNQLLLWLHLERLFEMHINMAEQHIFVMSP